MTGPDGAHLLAISDLHVGYPANREIVEALRPEHDDDWLLVAGDVAERTTDITWALSTLKQHFSTVIWLPGNHELWTPPDDPVQLRGDARYRHLVDDARRLGVITPRIRTRCGKARADPSPSSPCSCSTTTPGATAPPAPAPRTRRWPRPARQASSAPTRCSCTPTRCPAATTGAAPGSPRPPMRLDALDPDLPTVLANHWPLHREPTAVLHYPEFALWCGTEQTEQWHTRYRATEVVYGHLHIPRVIWRDGVRFTEVSLGYPREWGKRPAGPAGPRRILAYGEQAAHR